MVPILDLFESHFDGDGSAPIDDLLWPGFRVELAELFWERRVAFYWIGGRGKSMLGIWEVGTRLRG